MLLFKGDYKHNRGNPGNGVQPGASIFDIDEGIGGLRLGFGCARIGKADFYSNSRRRN